MVCLRYTTVAGLDITLGKESWRFSSVRKNRCVHAKSLAVVYCDVWSGTRFQQGKHVQKNGGHIPRMYTCNFTTLPIWSPKKLAFYYCNALGSEGWHIFTHKGNPSRIGGLRHFGVGGRKCRIPPSPLLGVKLPIWICNPMHAYLCKYLNRAYWGVTIHRIVFNGTLKFATQLEADPLWDAI